MKIAFFGTPEFAVPVFEKLVSSGHTISVAVTQPDRPVGRKQEITPTPVKIAAQKHNIPVLQPEKARDPGFLAEYKKYPSDINIIIAFGQILPDDLIYHPHHHSVNIHASLLPKYRGASPINWAIINGDGQTGVTYQFITKDLDAGDIIYQEKMKIEETDDSMTLYAKLSKLSAESVLKVIEMINAGTVKRVPQDHSKATVVKTLKKEEGKIDFNRPARDIFNQCRGLLPWPVSYCTLDGKSLKIYKCEPVHLSSKSAPGEIIEVVKGKGFMVKTAGETCLLVKEVQAEGSKRMDAWAFANGVHGLKGKVLA